MPTYRPVIMLSATDYQRFLEILDAPPAPNLALQKALVAFKESCSNANEAENPKQE